MVPDRKEAIAYCMQHAQQGDIVVLAGKGHEGLPRNRGGVKYPLMNAIVKELNLSMRNA